MTASATSAQSAVGSTPRYLKTMGLYNLQGVGPGLTNPFSLALSSDGRIFVLNRTAIRIVICTLDDEYLGDFATHEGSGDGDQLFGLPTDMAFDSQDRLHVVDEENHEVYVYDSSGGFLGRWGEHGSGDGQLDGPSGIAFDSEDNAFIVDQNNHRIQKFTGDGEYLLQWGGLGSGDGQLNLPWGICVDSNDNVYVADWRNDRVQKFAADGRFLGKFGESGHGDGQLSRPSGVAVDEDGNVYVADWGNERVQVLDSDGGFRAKLRGSATVSKWAADFLDSNLDEKLTRERANLHPPIAPHLDTIYHISSQNEPYFWGVASLTLDRERRLYVTESNRHRFQIYQTG